MGTNFYHKTPLTKKEIQHLKDSITEDPDLTNLKELIEVYSEKNKVIHLGKRSAGWQFLWNLNNKLFYDSNLKSIRKFLEHAGGWIEDEYGDKYTIDEFFNDEVGPWLYKDDKHHNDITYHESHPDDTIFTTPGKYEFESEDGLRFSKFTEFS